MKEIKLKGLNETIYEHVTKEGLTVYMWVNDHVQSTTMGLSVKYGSIHTKFKVGNKIYEVPNGIAHFLEHIKFNVDASTTAHDLFYKLGGDANAFTTFNYTSYTVFSNKNKNECLNTLLDYVYNPYFTTKMINKEKGIIIEEANMGEDDPYSVCFYKSLQNIFKNLNYRNLITGDKDDIKSITLKDIKLVYNTFYHPKNMFLVVCGNINPYEIAALVDENLSKKVFSEYQEPIIIEPTEPKKVNKKYDLVPCGVTYPKIKYSIKTPIRKFKNISRVDLKNMASLIMNINFGPTSLLFEELQSKELIDSMYFSTNYYSDYLLLSVHANTKYCDEVIKRIDNQFHNIDLNEQDIIRKRNATIATLILDYEDVGVVSSIIEDSIIDLGYIVDNAKELLENHTKERLESLYKLIDIDNASISVFIPKE